MCSHGNMIFVISLACTSVHNQSHTNDICTGEDIRKIILLCECGLMFSTKSGKCLTCDQSTWGLLSTDICDYFSVSCDAALQQCLVNCEGIVLT